MGYIKEPPGIDFIVESTPITQDDKEKISAVIAYYKKTGRKMPVRRRSSKPPRPKPEKSLD